MILYTANLISLVVENLNIISFSPDAQKEESHLVKLALPWIPMLDDYAWSDPLSMTKQFYYTLLNIVPVKTGTKVMNSTILQYLQCRNFTILMMISSREEAANVVVQKRIYNALAKDVEAQRARFRVY